jgi:hypothetical protein
LFKRITFFSLILINIIIFSKIDYAQRIVDKNKGDHNQTKKGFMDGNLAATVYYNFGEIADFKNEANLSGVWPKGTNHTYVDGVAIIVQAETKDPTGNVIHPLETNYYEFTRYDASTGITYGWWPLPGYAAPYSTSPARSDDNTTWPNTWPDRTSDWNGYWNGFFGKGVMNADLETYFVFDDNEDRDYILKNNFRPDADDPTRGGLGMQVKARAFQWSQVLAEDVIFWYYEITNMSTTDYDKTLFAQYIDWGIGGHDNSSNNAGDYNVVLSMSYAWSTVAFGNPGNWSPVGYAGYAFLESPGISDDGIDNDHDGLTDERRDNDAKVFITNVNQDPFIKNPDRDTVLFHQFYGYPWRQHWDADENANWRSYTDLNHNGKWDPGEPLNDDVGSDGIGPLDAGYTGPDADGSEGDGKPEQGEPNFGLLDKDESDQLGLTGFAIYAVHKYELNRDEENWTVLSGLPSPHNQPKSDVNLANYFSCYLFHLDGKTKYSQTTGTLEQTGETQRFSMGMIFGIDLGDLFRRKKTVQSIYNANYRFAKPPEKPIIKVIPGNHKVTLFWDNRAELTFDAFYQRYNFEGYRIYRSTEANFLEDKVITDAYGKATFRKPIAQFDKIDGITGLFPIDVNGALFDLGTDSGLQHSYIDTTVTNGQTYYYAVVAYDQGFTTKTVAGTFEGIPPSETPSIIKIDVNGKVKTDVNTAVAIPRAPGAGYIAPDIKNFTASGPGTGTVSIQALDPDSIRKSNTYRIEFIDNTVFHTNPHPSFRIIDYTTNDTLFKFSPILGNSAQTSVKHGISVQINNDTSVVVDQTNSRWIVGNSNYIVKIGFDSRYAGAYTPERVNFPGDFDINIVNPSEGDIAFPATSFSTPNPSNIRIKDITDGIDHAQFIFRDVNKDGLFNDNDAVFFVFGDSIGKKATDFSNVHVGWSVTIVKDTTIAPALQRAPQIGDVFRVITKKPFRTGEYFQFQSQAQGYDNSKALKDLNNIAVVPNPYVGAASWEPTTTQVGRGDRLVYFIHLPSQCTIRIYTISGKLVKRLDHSAIISNGQEPWNLITQDGMDVAFGIYIFHITAPGIGEKIGKFAIIK